MLQNNKRQVRTKIFIKVEVSELKCESMIENRKRYTKRKHSSLSHNCYHLISFIKRAARTKITSVSAENLIKETRLKSEENGSEINFILHSRKSTESSRDAFRKVPWFGF